MKESTSQCNAEKTFRYELEICKYISRFGALTSRQLGRLVWPTAKQGMRMAQNNCKRMIEDDRILRRELPNGGCINVLGERGARFLKENNVKNVSRRGGRDMTFKTPLHRMASNDFLIDCLLNGQAIYTEHEIQKGIAPVPLMIINGRKKIPDGLAYGNEGWWWIEVENAPKPKKRLAELMNLAAEFSENPQRYYKYVHNGLVHYIEQMLFVATNRACAIATYRMMKEHFEGGPISSNEIQINLARMSQGLVWGGCRDLFQVSQLYSFTEEDFFHMLDVAYPK